MHLKFKNIGLHLDSNPFTTEYRVYKRQTSPKGLFFPPDAGMTDDDWNNMEALLIIRVY